MINTDYYIKLIEIFKKHGNQRSADYWYGKLVEVTRPVGGVV